VQKPVEASQDNFTNDFTAGSDSIRLGTSDAVLAVDHFAGASIIDNLDTDKDGLSDYAEDRIVGLSKTNPKDISILNSWDTLTIKQGNGSVRKILLYQTSWYQNHYLNVPDLPNFLTSELSAIEIGKIKLWFPRVLKIFRTSAFQQYILNMPAGKIFGMEFINRARVFKKNVIFQSDPGHTQGANGTSNGGTRISLSHWIFLDHYISSQFATTIGHEYVHNLGYSHIHGYAYDGGYKIGSMYSKGAYDYTINDLETKGLYGVQ